MSQNSNSDFKRRKFTIPEPLDHVLQKMAEENYQGNVSLCLRAAIEDHQSTLNGTDSGTMVHQVRMAVENVASQQDQILDVVSSVETGLKSLDHGESATRVGIEGLPEEANRILSALSDSNTGLRIDDLTEQLDLPSSRIQPNVGLLIDYGLVTCNESPPRRYYLAGTMKSL